MNHFGKRTDWSLIEQQSIGKMAYHTKQICWQCIVGSIQDELGLATLQYIIFTHPKPEGPQQALQLVG